MNHQPTSDAACTTQKDSRLERAADTRAHPAPSQAASSPQIMIGHEKGSFARGAMVGLAIMVPFWLAVAAILIWVL